MSNGPGSTFRIKTVWLLPWRRTYAKSIHFIHGPGLRWRRQQSVHLVLLLLWTAVIYGPVVDASEGIISQSQSVMCNKRSAGRGSIFLALCLSPAQLCSGLCFSLWPCAASLVEIQVRGVSNPRLLNIHSHQDKCGFRGWSWSWACLGSIFT